jgi:GNAT superfamily N-acetyltransferase
VREVNTVRVETTARELRAGELAFAAESRFPCAPAAEVLHEPIGAALAPAFAAAGWQVSRHLLMAHEGSPPAVPHPVEEVAPEDVWPLRAEWLRSEPWGNEEAVSAMLTWERERAAMTGARAFCARVDGQPAAMCLLLATPHADEVERVYTTPRHRGRGLAYAVVARAAQEAADQLTFLFTDAHGAAQHLYARLGFRHAWVVYRFLSRVPADRGERGSRARRNVAARRPADPCEPRAPR